MNQNKRKHEEILTDNVLDTKLSVYIESRPIINEMKQLKSDIIKIPVPPEGDCLFWSCGLGVLVPLVNDEKEFKRIYDKIFVDNGETGYSISVKKSPKLSVESDACRSYIHKALMTLRLNEGELDKLSFWDPLKQLFTDVLRNRIVDYMEIKGFSVPPEKKEELYFLEMRNTGWGGDIELNAFGQMAGVRCDLTWANGYETSFGSNQSQIFLKIFSLNFYKTRKKPMARMKKNQ